MVSINNSGPTSPAKLKCSILARRTRATGHIARVLFASPRLGSTRGNSLAKVNNEGSKGELAVGGHDDEEGSPHLI